MQKVHLGFSKIEVSTLGIGTWQAAGREWGSDVQDQAVIDALVRASQLGVNLFDTAEAYGNGHSEEVVGKAIREIGRENVVIATKVYGAHLHHDELIKAADASARRLGVKEIDLYQVHWPDPWEQVPLRDTMRALEELYKAGKIKAIGVSNFAVRDLKEAREHLSSVDISSNQVRYNLLQREVEEEVLPYCKKEGIAVLAWSPLAQGALTGKYSPENRPSDDVRKGNRLFTDHNLKESAAVLETLKKIGQAHHKTPAQVALRWLIEKGTIPIPGAKNRAQAEENAGAASFALEEREVKELDLASQHASIDYFP
ncbi:MAG: aldo/keto reductase [Thermoprotei archaeon]|nr:aldo/keto reductase [TACK group archaeon]